MQLALLQDGHIKKTIINAPIERVTISAFNPRTTRPEEDVVQLAKRIARNGFEITRALWVYQNGTGYEAFAGGTRLEAARRAGCKTVPVVLHEGLTEEDIVRLAYEDNENDEYHAQVSVVDVWADYAKLKALGWTQERIAEAVGVKQAMVSYRLKLHEMPDKIKDFITQESLEETHLREIMQLSLELYFSDWLTISQAHEELATVAAKRKLSVRQTKDLVTAWKEVIVLAQRLYDKLDTDWQPIFVKRLAMDKARTQAQVQHAFNETIADQLETARLREEELARQQNEAEAERLRLEAEQERNQRTEEILNNIHLGDFRQVCATLEAESVEVIITDPPYAEEYVPLYGALAEQAARLLKPGGSLLVMCGQSYLPEILALMTPHLSYHWTLNYQTPGGQSPQIWPKKVNTFWKPVLWFTTGDYRGDWKSDVIKSDVNDNDKRFHDWGQSESGITRLVENFSEPGDLVLDPFLGGGTVGLVALQAGRRFIGIDVDQDSVNVSKERIFTWLNENEQKDSITDDNV